MGDVEKFFSQVKGERPFVVEADYGDDTPKANGAKYYSNLGWVVDLDEADPEFVENYAPKKYSVADFFNGVFSGREYSSEADTSGDGSFTLYDDQRRLQDKLLKVYDDYGAGFLNASDTGTGKTITTVSTLKKTSARTILVVAPKSVLPSWRDTLISAGDADKLWILINYESLGKLLLPSKHEKEAKKKSTKNDRRAKSGIPILDFDVVVFDECHYMGNPTSLRSKMGRRIVAGSGGEDAFQLWLSATFGKDPTKTGFLYPALSESAGGESKTAEDFTVSRYAALCKKLGVHGVTSNNKGGLTDFSGTEVDLKRFSSVVFTGDHLFGDRIESRDEQIRETLAVDLSRSEKEKYNALWTEFINEYQEILQTGGRKKAREPEGLAVQIRFRQKAGLLRAPYMVDAIRDFLAEGHQVAVSCEFSDTVELIRQEMEDKRLAAPAIFTGKNLAQREDERLAFQRGEKKVILFSTAEGINLQANDKLVGNPSSAARDLLIAEPRWSPVKMAQIEGRTQRNRETSTAWYAYASGTIESRVISRMISGMSSVALMRGDKEDKIKSLRRLSSDVLSDIISLVNDDD